MRNITTVMIKSFNDYLINEEKAVATVNKYLHDVSEFQIWLGEREICKAVVLAYKSHLCEHYAPASVNAALSSLNSFFDFMEWYDLRVKSLKIQKQIFASTDKELTKAEYDRLLSLDADDMFYGYPSVRGALRDCRGGSMRDCRDQLQGQAQAGVPAEAALSDLEAVYQGAKNKKRSRVRDEERQSA